MASPRCLECDADVCFLLSFSIPNATAVYLMMAEAVAAAWPEAKKLCMRIFLAFIYVFKILQISHNVKLKGTNHYN